MLKVHLASIAVGLMLSIAWILTIPQKVAESPLVSITPALSVGSPLPPELLEVVPNPDNWLIFLPDCDSCTAVQVSASSLAFSTYQQRVGVYRAGESAVPNAWRPLMARFQPFDASSKLFSGAPYAVLVGADGKVQRLRILRRTS